MEAVGRRERVWVALLSVSTRTRNKIVGDHQIQEQEVRDVVVCQAGLEYRWELDPNHGWKAVVSCEIRGRPCAIVLFPAPHPLGDAWHLGSAYFVD
jgi:hypothetical protein